MEEEQISQYKNLTTNPAADLLCRIGQGLAGAVYAAVVLFTLLVVSAVAGLLLVNYWVEEPVVIRQKLFFDYTEVNPSAVAVFGKSAAAAATAGGGVGLPVGHRFRVSVTVLVPDSEFNRRVGVFQISADVISTKGKIITRSSQPTMMRFQSRPIRLLRTFATAIPLVLGLTHETQTISIQVLNYKETTHQRTDAILITLMPRAGPTTSPYLLLPQLYEAELVIESKLPRVKELIYNWKWTLYVWTSSYIYLLLLLTLAYFLMPLLIYPFTGSWTTRGPPVPIEKPESENESARVTGSLRKWQQYRKKRKAELLSSAAASASGSASSYTVTKDGIATSVVEEEEVVGDSESSVCKED